jgi:hypothetical protein
MAILATESARIGCLLSDTCTTPVVVSGQVYAVLPNTAINFQRIICPKEGVGRALERETQNQTLCAQKAHSNAVQLSKRTHFDGNKLFLEQKVRQRALITDWLAPQVAVKFDS